LDVSLRQLQNLPGFVEAKEKTQGKWQGNSSKQASGFLLDCMIFLAKFFLQAICQAQRFLQNFVASFLE
jgi:hypothetical protein